MIKHLELRNFRRHVDLSIAFNGGLTAIRGGNEQGKSTCIEGILYALFGAKALRNTLADTVTWGVAESKLSAVLVLESEGKTYTFKRSKGGAEVVVDGTPFVVGQTEVTAFAANLLGVDATTASKLMLASQNGLRGSLEQGPKATSTMIEGLADFDLFDRLLERMQEKLLLGAPALLEGRVAQTSGAIDALVEVAEPDVAALQQQAADYEMEIVSLQKDLDLTLLPAEQAAHTLHNTSQKQATAFEMASNALNGAKEEYRKTFADLTSAQAGVTGIDPAPLEALKDGLRATVEASVVVGIYQAMEALMRGYPEDFWEGSLEELEADIAATAAKVESTRSSIAQIDSDLRVWKSQKITTSVCGFCNQDVSQFPEVAKKNAELDEKITGGHASHAMWTTYLSERQEELRALRSVLASSKPYDDFIARYGDRIDVDYDTVPPQFTWRGPVITNSPKAVAEIKAQITALEQEHAAIRRNSALVEVLGEKCLSLKAHIQSLESKLATMPTGGNLEETKSEAEAATVAVYAAKAVIQDKQVLADYARSRAKEAIEDYELFQRQKADLSSAWSAAKEDLARLHFNNNLLKKVRAARPIIADQLWAAVLMAVSTMFSQMRGEKTVITKDKDGFKANGQSVESLSGSTLDLLGLAIRVALIKTFLPNCPFVILDEPAHGCDDDRTIALLGFLAGAGFQQTIIVTHDDTSEAVADSLITL